MLSIDNNLNDTAYVDLTCFFIDHYRKLWSAAEFKVQCFYLSKNNTFSDSSMLN